jgi:hypothetical protein
MLRSLMADDRQSGCRASRSIHPEPATPTRTSMDLV